MARKKSVFMFIISLMILCFLFVGVSASQCIPGEPCDDGDACTYDDQLDSRCNCIGTPIVCDDDIDCSIDSCSEGECVFDYSQCEGTPCGDDSDCADDNNYCDGTYWVHETESCINEQCLPASSTGNCDDGEYCNGDETCEGEGICVDGTDIVCDNPPEPEQCYDEGYCDEKDNLCVYPFLDEEGPSIYDLLVDPWFNGGVFDLSAIAEDECSSIQTAEYFLGYIGSASCGDEGTGTLIHAEDGNFDELIEELLEEDVNYLEHDGVNWVCIRAQDNEDNWGDCECLYYQSDLIIPEEPVNVKINDVLDANELLVCGEDPTLTAKVCDTQSPIQGGEYFIDLTIPPLPDPFTGEWMTASESWIEGLYRCANISAVIDMDRLELEDGTHYIKLRGKDNKEWWGKMLDYYVSFIKDTTAPSTTKVLNPTGDISVPCQIDNPVNGNTITDGCYYVKSGTTIDLSATDPDPQGTGEFAGDVIINYRVYWSEYCDDDWTLDQEGQSGIDQPVTITLDEDSCHLIEYWAEDLCGNEETHHFELDIVDTQAPVTTKDVLGENVIAGDLNPIHYYLGQGAYIELTCEDGEPHPVGMEELYWTIEWSEDCDDPSWEMMTSDGYSDDGSAQIRFGEESCHRLTYWCADGLGNTETEQVEIDAVDWTAPEIIKTIEGPWFGDCPPEDCEDVCYIDGVTEIHVTANDVGPHPVGDIQCEWSYVWNNEEYGPYSEGSSFTIAGWDESEHYLSIYCWDALGNDVEDYEIFLVDKSGPAITKEYGTPFYSDGIQDFDESVILDAADRIIALQAEDGSWDWDVTYATGPTGTTYLNIAGVTAEVLIDAYEMTHDSKYLDAAKNAGDYLITQIGDPSSSQRQNAFSIMFLYNLADITGDSQYSDEADLIMTHILHEENYWSLNNGNHCTSSGCTASQLLEALKDYRSWSTDPTGIVPWDLYKFVEAGQRYGDSTFADDMANEIDSYMSQVSFDNTIEYYELGLSAGIMGLDNAGLDYSSYLTALLSQQQIDGSFGTTEPIQTTAYALMALHQVGDDSNAIKAALYLITNFGYDSIDGWLEGGVEYSEVTSEAAQALSVISSTGVHWITSDTPVYISAEDVLPHPSGLDSLEYRVTLVDDEACWSDDICQITEGEDDWTEVDGSSTEFKIKGTSCHLIEIYAEDNVEKYSTHKQCVFVDNEAPDETNKVIGEPKYLCEDGEEKCGSDTEWDAYYVKTSTPITLSCEDVNPHPVGNENVCFKISWEDNCPQTPPYMTEEYCSEFDGEYNPTNGECCVAVDTEKEFTFHFLEESLHNIEWYCEDALGNRGDDNIEYDNVDDTPPVIIIWNPTLLEASSVERCTQSVVVQAFDMKSGVDESSVYAELYYNNGTAVPEHKVTLKKTIYGTYEGLMDKQLPAGMYVLKVFATDNIGNQQEVSRVEHLTETVFVELINPARCDIDPTQGGSCNFTYHVCMRGDNSVQLWINKLAGIITPDMMNATIIDPDNEENDAFVGLRHDWFISPAGILQLGENCTEINGKEQFTLHLDVPANYASQLGMGKHDLQYWIRASLQPEICVS